MSSTPPNLLQVSAQNVIDMFKELSLPVCDDGSLIEENFKKRRPYYLKCQGNPDPNIHAKGMAGVKNGELLKNRRTELLKVVYEHFVHLADVAISSAIAAGVSTLTDAVIDNLRNVLLTACKVDDALADRFLADFMRDRAFTRGKKLVNPGLISNLTAESGTDRITLQWRLPSDHCDEIEIVRTQDSPSPGQTEKTFAKKRAETTKVIFKAAGQTTSFVDQDVTAGVRYSYRAHSIYQSVSGSDAAVRAVCIGEVTAARAVWQTGRVVLSWELPGADVAVLIFRRLNAAPTIKRAASDPQAANSQTTQVYRGSGETWTDDVGSEGVTYHYLIIADFGAGVFSNGVEVQATVPKPPAAVASLKAIYKPDAGKGVVSLEWQPSTTGQVVEYVAVRREGEVAPARIDDGNVVEITTQTRCLDRQVVPGKRYTYAVFVRVGDLHSRGTFAAPVDILAEVSDLKAETYEGAVELRWTAPANTSRIIVRRGLNPPPDHREGVAVSVLGSDRAKDESLQDGRRYHYLVCCAYRPDGRKELVSAGVRVAVVPDRLPHPVNDFNASSKGTEVVCTWTPPKHGVVVIIRSAESLGLAPGHRFGANNLNELGHVLVTSETGGALDPHPDDKQPHYTIITVAGSHAVAGGSSTVVVCPDVDSLALSLLPSGVVLRWNWPAGCKTVRVVRRVGRWPSGPQDSESVSMAVTRTEYAAAGDRFVDRLDQVPGHYHYVVFAHATGVPGSFFASGSNSGCRASVQWKPWTTLRYSLLSGRRKDFLTLKWSVDHPSADFPGFTIVAGENKVPASPEEGIQLYRWTPAEGSLGGPHETSISLAPVQQRGWARFFCSLFAIEPTKLKSTIIIHPNTCRPISSSGAIETRQAEKVARSYKAGIPRTVICPRCFDEFPVADMLFASPNDDSETKQARNVWLNRLIGKSSKPPANSQGQTLSRRLCPKGRHVLPNTAGARETLIIGLIGAKYSGKSHYIAALVKRLQEQVGTDIEASFTATSDETQDRYNREFHAPLFGNGLELPVTVGTPPPLIYDLTLSGRLWGETRNRGVILTLYDTAGENLDRDETVRQMVNYLRPASGIIFLIDPLQERSVRDALPPQVPLPQLDGSADPNSVITRVLQVLKEGGVMNDTLATPIAVALTKCDVLRDAGLIAENRLWSTNASHVGYFDDEANEDMTGMMGSYVQRWSLAAYNTVVRHFSRHAFFGVSATGCAPDKKTRRYKFISPWRVEDPLLWLLAELGVIPRR